jgi:cell fate (sporulation/competence/biofilm development) regulator YlbF (YheA/YmcA/DUF963 family)
MEAKGDLSGVEAELREFASALRAAEAVRRLQDAARQLREDPEVHQLQEAFDRAEKAGRQGPQDDGLRERQDEMLREAQLAYQRHPAVREWFQAELEVRLLLRSVNATISDILGLDFGQTVRSARGG